MKQRHKELVSRKKCLTRCPASRFKMEIVIDKSFLDGSTTEQIRLLCGQHTVLFSEILLFELMTTSLKSQKRCFSKFPATPNPVVLIPSVGTLLSYEIKNGVSCMPLIERKIQEDFKFNERLALGTFIPGGDVKLTIEEWLSLVRNDTINFLERCAVVYQFFPELNGVENKEFYEAINQARIRIATDEDFVKEIYASFLDENAPPDAPKPDVIDKTWAFFRWVQCQILSALRIFGKYQGKIELPVTNGVFTHAEHTMHDIHYTILASLSDALASIDKEIINDSILCNPGGVLVTKE